MVHLESRAFPVESFDLSGLLSELDSSQSTMMTKKSLVRAKHRARATSKLLEIARVWKVP